MEVAAQHQFIAGIVAFMHTIRHVGILRWYELGQTDCVRILLLRRNSDAYDSIEVELTLPEQLSERISHSAKKINLMGTRIRA